MFVSNLLDTWLARWRWDICGVDCNVLSKGSCGVDCNVLSKDIQNICFMSWRGSLEVK